MAIKKQTTIPLNDRDVSWLSFNYRVLQEVKDTNVPLLARIMFMAIYSSNLEEFFKVRVAYHRSLKRLDKGAQKDFRVDPAEEINTIKRIVKEQQEELNHVFNQQIIPELRKYDVHFKHWSELTEDQSEFVQSYFKDHMLAFVQPVLLAKQSIRPFLTNAALYLAVSLGKKSEKPNKPLGKLKYAIVKVPSDYLPRFIELPTEHGHEIIMLDDIVRYNISGLFPGYKIIDSFSIKLTRDAELYIEDEFEGDLVEKIKVQLNRRNLGATTRFVYDKAMPEEMLQYMSETFHLKKDDLQPEDRYHNNFDFFKFPNFGLKHLHYAPMPPMRLKALTGKGILRKMKARDYLLHYPYHTYDHTVQFFEEAAADPNVTCIKIIQYRVARRSRIMEALIQAAQSGKEVVAFVEVKARFDEDANLQWSNTLKAAGVKILYSFPGLKVHSKLALVVRKEEHGEQLYSYLSTGNFHEKTAKLYSDLGLLTTDPRLTNEVRKVFKFLETSEQPAQPLQHLLVGQINLRAGLDQRINREIENAKAGKKARIILKMNSLEDPVIIKKLYEASEAGVQIDMIVRGICCLVPQKKDFSKNIHAISILDRFLEHARIFYFYDNGAAHIYLSSADFMRRNLNRRIETTFPIYDEAAKREIIDFLNIQLKDNVKARILDADMQNNYQKNNQPMPIRSQVEMYHYLKRKNQ